jgi:hypothetical protein
MTTATRVRPWKHLLWATKRRRNIAKRLDVKRRRFHELEEKSKVEREK